MAEPLTLWGSVGGNVTVVAGGKFYVRGAIYGDLTVEDGGRVHVLGHVQGRLVVREGAKVIHSGLVGGRAINDGGRLYVEAAARVLGGVSTKRGDTKISSRFQQD